MWDYRVVLDLSVDQVLILERQNRILSFALKHRRFSLNH